MIKNVKEMISIPKIKFATYMRSYVNLITEAGKKIIIAMQDNCDAYLNNFSSSFI